MVPRIDHIVVGIDILPRSSPTLTTDFRLMMLADGGIPIQRIVCWTLKPFLPQCLGHPREMDMITSTSTKNLLASLAVFRDLYDSNSNIYEIIDDFLIYTISSRSLYYFSVSEITEAVNDIFAFKLPEAIVATSISKIGGITRESGRYRVDPSFIPNSDDLESEFQTITKQHNEIINILHDYIHERNPALLIHDDSDEPMKSLCNYMLDENHSSPYSVLISTFIIDNKTNAQIQEQLRKIKEGVVIYSGIRYANPAEVGSWNSTINIYLDTEILFHAIGLNGELLKSQFNDFFEIVQNINHKRRLIHLRYFDNVKQEIYQYFKKAEDIVTGRSSSPSTRAMQIIVNGCKNRSDVAIKESGFWSELKRMQILEDEKINYFDERYAKFNIISAELLDQFGAPAQRDFVYQDLIGLNNINVRRRGSSTGSLEQVGDIFVTGTATSLEASWSEKLRGKDEVPLAVSLDYIATRMWTKSTLGFGKAKSPASFDPIIKAQLVLSNRLGENLSNKFDYINQEFQAGKLPIENATKALALIRSKMGEIDHIATADTQEALKIISETDIHKFIEEADYYKILATKTSEELSQTTMQNTKSTAMLQEVLNQLGREKDKEQNAQMEIKSLKTQHAKHLKLRIQEISTELKTYEKKKILAEKLSRRAQLLIKPIFIITILASGFSIFILAQYSEYNSVKKTSLLIGICITTLALAFIVVFGKEWSFLDFYNKVENSTKRVIERTVCRMVKFNPIHHAKLIGEISIHSKDLEQLNEFE